MRARGPRSPDAPLPFTIGRPPARVVQRLMPQGDARMLRIGPFQRVEPRARFIDFALGYCDLYYAVRDCGELAHMHRRSLEQWCEKLPSFPEPFLARERSRNVRPRECIVRVALVDLSNE